MAEIIFKKSHKRYCLIISIILLIYSFAYIIEKSLIKFEDNIKRNLAEDNYISLYFNSNCTYSQGFKNNYRNGISYIINKENNKQLTDEDTLIINENFGIEIHFNIISINLEYFFSRNIDENMKYLQYAYFDNLDTTLITNMKSAFQNCNSLSYIYLSDLDMSNVFEMDNMFDGCTSLDSVYLSNLDLSKVISMGHLFNNCSTLKNVYISDLKTSSLLYMASMFEGCDSLTSIDISNFDTSLVSNIENLFYGCSSLTSINLSDFNTSSSFAMNGIFYGCDSLKYLDISNFDMK